VSPPPLLLTFTDLQNFPSDPTGNARLWNAVQDLCNGGNYDNVKWTILGYSPVGNSQVLLKRLQGQLVSSDLRNWVHSSPTRKALALNVEGIKALKDGNYDLALEKCSDAIDRDGNYSISYANRSAVWVKKTQLDAALADVENVSLVLISHCFESKYNQKSIKLDPVSELGYQKKANILHVLCYLDDEDLKKKLISTCFLLIFPLSLAQFSVKADSLEAFRSPQMIRQMTPKIPQILMTLMSMGRPRGRNSGMLMSVAC
jgi:hypothetical protein